MSFNRLKHSNYTDPLTLTNLQVEGTSVLDGTIKTSRSGNSFGGATGGAIWGGYIPIIEVRATSTSDSGLNIFTNSGPIIRAYDSSGNARGAWNADGSIVVGQNNTKLGTLSVYADSASTVGTIIRGATAQVSSLEQWQDSVGNVLASVAPSGTLILGGIVPLNTLFGLTLYNKTMAHYNTTNNTAVISALAFARGNSTGLWMNITQTGDGANGVASVDISDGSNVKLFSVGQSGNTLVTNTLTTAVPLTVKSAASQTADLLQLQNSTPTTLGGRNANAQIYSGSTTTINSSIGAVYSVQVNSATEGQINFVNPTYLADGDLIVVAAASGTSIIPAATYVIPTSGVFNTGTLNESYIKVTLVGATVSGATTTASSLPASVRTPAQASVTARSAGTKGLIVRAATSSQANLQEWQNSAGSILAVVSQTGGIYGAVIGTNNSRFYGLEENSGAFLALTRQTAAGANLSANQAKIYFRDGTTAGTLKLVVRAGTAGAETTILDNIPQT